MKNFAIAAALLGAWWVASALPDFTPDAGPAPTVAAHARAAPAEALQPATLDEVVRQYCVVCHNDALLTGNVSLQSFQGGIL